MKGYTKKIVKVQVSIASSDGEQSVLMYDEDQYHTYEGPAEKFLLDMMKGEDKKFFYAYCPNKPGIIEIIKQAPWQNW